MINLIKFIIYFLKIFHSFKNFQNPHYPTKYYQCHFKYFSNLLRE